MYHVVYTDGTKKSPKWLFFANSDDFHRWLEQNSDVTIVKEGISRAEALEMVNNQPLETVVDQVIESARRAQSPLKYIQQVLPTLIERYSPGEVIQILASRQVWLGEI